MVKRQKVNAYTQAANDLIVHGVDEETGLDGGMAAKEREEGEFKIPQKDNGKMLKREFIFAAFRAVGGSKKEFEPKVKEWLKEKQEHLPAGERWVPSDQNIQGYAAKYREEGGNKLYPAKEKTVPMSVDQYDLIATLEKTMKAIGKPVCERIMEKLFPEFADE